MQITLIEVFINPVKEDPVRKTQHSLVDIIKWWYTKEYYSATRNNDMELEVERMQLEDIMLSEVS
jgi:hypothetical protein